MLGKVCNRSEPQFTHLLMRIIIMRPFAEDETKSKAQALAQTKWWERSPLVPGDRQTLVTVWEV